MQEDNFPLTPKGEIFQLPPNSPHYLFEQLKEKTYTATEILNFMKIYFSANGLLS